MPPKKPARPVKRPKRKPPKRPKPKLPKRPKPKPPRPDVPRQPKPGPKPFRKPHTHLVGELEAYLAANPSIASAIKWNGKDSPGYAWERYPNWTALQKGELAKIYYQIRSAYRRSRVRVFPGLSEAPSFASLDQSGLGTIYDHAVAWPYFLAYVAHSLVVEILGLVPWSLKSCSPEELDRLLTPTGLYLRNTGSEYLLDEAATPGDPVRMYQFLASNGFLRPNRRETIGCLLDWCRVNMRHWYGGFNPAVAMAYWQYNGYPPVERVLAGTTHVQYGFSHWTLGCVGTTGFLCAVLRTANIPIEPMGAGGHSMPHFMSESLYLSHGDDPYDGMLTTIPPIPIDRLFIDENTFLGWLGPTVAAATQSDNVARQPKELALEYLTDWILRLRCQDIAQGVTDHATSAVYTENNLRLFKYYTVAGLEAMNLWDRLDMKIAAIGGCANVPQ